MTQLTTCFGFLVLLASATSTMAGAIHARSDVPAHVYLDGQKLGTTPLNLSNVTPGRHAVELRSTTTGEARAFDVSIPKGASAAALVEGTFAVPVVEEVQVSPPVVARVIAAPAVVVPPPRRRIVAPVFVQPSVVYVGGRRGFGRRWW